MSADIFTDEHKSTETRELSMRRIFKAPVDLVFQMFTEPEHITNWWGPHGFRTTTHKMELRPGGLWLHTMHGPDGTDYPNQVGYLEVKPPQRLVYEQGLPDTEPMFRSFINFKAEDGYTVVSFRMIFPDTAARDQSIATYGADQGLLETLDRLAILITRSTGTFAISRAFHAPLELVWQAWTTAEHLMHWWGPAGCKTEIKTLELKPGGIFHYRMLFPDGKDMWGKFVFRDIDAPNRLTFVNSFSNAAGDTVRPPFSDTWPVEMLNTIMLQSFLNKTAVTIQSKPLQASETERQTFIDGHESMQQGWSGSLEVLSAYLNRL